MSENSIIESIIEASKKEAEAMLQSANNEADKRLENAKKELKQVEHEKENLSQKEAENRKRVLDSNYRTEMKNRVLKARYDEIEKTIEMIPDSISNLSNDKYFSVMKKLIEKHKTDEHGEIIFNKKDKKRLPKEFMTSIDNLKLSDSEVDTECGFVLKYGDVFIDCTIEALINEHRDEITDAICSTLFSNDGK